MIAVWCFKAEACKSVGTAMKKCPSGMYAEIKYDGERVQVIWNWRSYCLSVVLVTGLV